MNVKCLVCERPLVAIGHNRVNGQCHSDWASRKYHKQCFKELVRCVIYFDIPFENKDKAKALGARFDFEVKAWYAPNTTVAALLHTFKFERKFI
jgi:hypothetical protein